MGYTRHHAIVVTGWDGMEAIRERVADICDDVAEISPLTDKAMNGYRSFFVAPDGSKEGWDDSDAGDAARSKVIEFLESFRYDDGSTSVDWVEVQFGDDEHETLIVNHSDEASRRKAAW